ncbi:histidine kinase, partial [Streptomyces mirabilis]
MTETTQTQMKPPGEAKPRSPEFRLAADALRGLRQDLFHDAFAYRPLPRMRVDGPLARRLPERVREYAAWTPHAVITACGLLAMAVASTANQGGPGIGSLVPSLLALLPVLLTLVRPVGAFWFSMAATPFAAVFSDSWGEWPWSEGAFITHLVVLTVVALRTRPRTAAWMWVLTAWYGFMSESLFGAGHMGGNAAPLLFLSALALLAVTVLHVRRTAEQEVTAHQSETAQERSRRTLLEERTTIARELHDVVAHHMSVVAIQAEAAPYRVEN